MRASGLLNKLFSSLCSTTGRKKGGQKRASESGVTEGSRSKKHSLVGTFFAGVEATSPNINEGLNTTKELLHCKVFCSGNQE